MNGQTRCDGESTIMSAVVYGYINLSRYGVKSVCNQVAVQSQIKICKLLSQKRCWALSLVVTCVTCPIGPQGPVTWHLQVKKIG